MKKIIIETERGAKIVEVPIIIRCRQRKIYDNSNNKDT